MNILDNAKKTLNSTTIAYGFVGITTVILSYFTFFENDIEKPLDDPQLSVPPPLVPPPLVPPPSAPQPQLFMPQPSVPQPLAPQQPIFGGKNKRKKTTH
jgi:hypothetical protein